MGDTSYYMMGETEETIRRYIDSRAANGFNFIRFLAIGTYDGTQVPGFWPFDGTPQNTNWIIDEEKMEKLDRVFDYAASKNVNIELIMWGYGLDGGNGMWGDVALEDLWIDTLAYRYRDRKNLLMWTVTNEFERYPSHDDNYTFEWSDVDGMNRIVSRIKSIDSVHNAGVHAGAAMGIDGWGPLIVSHLWQDSAVDINNVFLRSGHWNATWMFKCPYAASHNIEEWGVLYVPTLWNGELMIPQWEDDEGWILEPLNMEDGIADDWNAQPARPYINTEFGYQYEAGLPDNHPNLLSCQLFSQDTVRKSAWLTAASGGYLAAGFVHTVKDIDEDNIETFRPEQLRYLYDFFSKRTEYWKMAPHHEWVDDKNALLALPRLEYVAYFPRGLRTDNYVYLHSGTYSVEWLNPRTGEYTKRIIIDVGTGKKYFTPPKDINGDWVLHLKNDRPESYRTKPSQRIS